MVKTTEQKFTMASTPSLPNNIIMRIIREADGGRVKHQKKFSETITYINGMRRTIILKERGGDYEDKWVAGSGAAWNWSSEDVITHAQHFQNYIGLFETETWTIDGISPRDSW